MMDDGSAGIDTRCTKTTCPYCGVGCGVVVSSDASGKEISVSGDPDHPANFGRLCSKGSALHETLSLEGRLLEPFVDGVAADWDHALNVVAERFSRCIQEHGPESVAFYVSGQLLTEDYYVANKLMKGFIGTANIDTNSRLCMASSVAGHKRAFGTDTVPGCYEDLEIADLVVLVGSNLAWCHPVLYQRLVAAKELRPELKVVVIDPRRTATCELADLHLAIEPGADVALFNGLLAYLNSQKCVDANYVSEHTSGVDQALEEAQKHDQSSISRCTSLTESELQEFYDLFASTPRTVTVYSQGVNQSSRGTDKVNAIINCHLLTGRIGKPGMGPFSVTGQPNAMGGREVGGLANQLASHMELDNPDHRDAIQKFWNAPTIADKPGLKAVDLFNAVGDGRVKAIWIMATNPADSLPEADKVCDALRNCPFVVVSDVEEKTDTTQIADVLLPAAAWGEKDGTVTNSERRISRQRSFLPLPGKCKPDWWVISEVAKRMGFEDAFSYRAPHEIFNEYVQSTGLGDTCARDLDLSELADQTNNDYNTLQPVMWPCKTADHLPKPTRFFADGGFFTPDKKGRFIATPFVPPSTAISKEFPLSLNTGRVRDQWHTMTRTAKSPRLLDHIGEPFVEIHPDDANARDITAASLVEICSPHGRAIVRAVITDRQKRGSVFVPIHWTDQFSSAGRIDCVVSPETDPVSGQPESKFTPVEIEPWCATWYGFAVVAEKPPVLPASYWAIAKSASGWRLELAGKEAVDNWTDAAKALLFGGEEASPNNIKNNKLLTYQDVTKGQYRFVAFDDAGAPIGALFIAPDPVAVSRTWASDLLSQSFPTPAEQLSLLAARAGADQPDRGAIVCSCFSVGVNQIVDAIANQRCMSVDQVGKQLQAGTNCGSCRPEIRRLIDDTGLSQAS